MVDGAARNISDAFPSKRTLLAPSHIPLSYPRLLCSALHNMLSLLLLLLLGCLAYTTAAPLNSSESPYPIRVPPIPSPIPIRVAFVLAGSPRSFVYPHIHESIRFNLINAFCPPSSCVADVFARVSGSDNTHEVSLCIGKHRQA